jgi:uncharacterized protein (TIGR02145 family)
LKQTLLFTAATIIFTLFSITGCKKDDNEKMLPVLTTNEVTDITTTSAKSGGNITDDDGSTITERGVCWSTGQNPTINDNKTSDGAGAGSFASSITGLEPNTTYFVRAYATNTGTGYGSAMSFTTQEGSSGSTFTDPRDGKVYQTIVIGDQEWMAENLAYAPSSGNYWAYDNDDANVETYGYLYDWQTALNACPEGWHLPTDDEWTELTDYLGENAGGKLKATGTIEAGTGLWYDPNTGATNETGFTALPGGYRNSDGNFSNLGSNSYLWSSTEYSSAFAWSRLLYYFYASAYRGYNNEGLGFSIRCLRD